MMCGEHSIVEECEREDNRDQQTQEAQYEGAPPGQLILNRHEPQADAFRQQPVSEFLRGDEVESPVRAGGGIRKGSDVVDCSA